MDEAKITEAYEKTLQIPKNKLEKQIMICPVGTVGSGKTTVIKPLSGKLSLLRISTDEIRKLLKENGYGYDNVRKLAYALAEKYISKGFSVAMDGNCSSDEAQEKINQIKDKYDIKVFWVHINTPEEFILNKLKSYKHTWLFKNADEAIENYRISKAKHHKHINFPFVYTFDTSRDNLDEQIKEAVAVIGENIKDN